MNGVEFSNLRATQIEPLAVKSRSRRLALLTTVVLASWERGLADAAAGHVRLRSNAHLPEHDVAGCGRTGQVAPGRDTDKGCKSDGRSPSPFVVFLHDGGRLL